jgi:hypothetical protein
VKIFCVTKKTLDLGFGDAPPEWVRVVRADDRAEIEEVLHRYDVVLISIKELKGINLSEFDGFLRERLPLRGDSHQVTDEEFQQMLGGV